MNVLIKSFSKAWGKDFSGTAKLAISRAADLIDTYGFACTCLGSFIIHLATSSQLLKLFDRMLILHADVPVSATHILVDICCGIVYEVVYTVLSIIADPFDNTNFVFYVVEVVTYVALELLSFITFLQFTHLVLACYRLFKDFNCKIAAILEVIDNFSLTTCVSKRELAVKVRELSCKQAELVSASKKINELFGAQNALSVLLIFLQLTYATFNAMVDSDRAGKSSGVLWDAVLWAGYFIYKLLATLTVCSLTTAACNETATLLMKVTYKINDPLVDNEVENFALQMLHYHSSFDALGFFPLNFTLIYSMIASVAGYLIILVQFSHGETSVCSIGNQYPSEPSLFAVLNSFNSSIEPAPAF